MSLISYLKEERGIQPQTRSDIIIIAGHETTDSDDQCVGGARVG